MTNLSNLRSISHSDGVGEYSIPCLEGSMQFGSICREYTEQYAKLFEMKILIDVTRLVDRFMKGRLPTGVDRVGLAYVQHYRHNALAVIRWAGRSWVMPRAQSAALFDWLFAPVSAREAVAIIAHGMLTGWRGQRVAGSFLFNTGHSGLELPEYPAMLRKMGVRPLFVVHDLIPITHPEYCRAGEDARHITRMSNLLALAHGVITNSQATLDDLSEFANKSSLPMPSAVVALLAPGMMAASPGVRPLAAQYFVMLGTIEPRKNHIMLLQVWRQLVERLGEQAPRLVVIGQRGWECENVVDLLERCTSLKGAVIELQSCSDQELVTWLHHAQALLFPSFVEGYGMPLVEALALGVPVIASDLPVFREIAQSIPEYVNPLDGKRWIDLIMDYAQPDSASRAAQLLRMVQFNTPDWAEHFVKVDAMLDQLNTATGSSEMPRVLYIYQFPYWKWPVVRQCFPQSKIVFVERVDSLPANACLVLWGMREVPAGVAADILVLRMEDGFLRSVGLGADLIRPMSWIVDKRGIYYDATRVSDLEVLLATLNFDPSMLARAAALRARVVATGLTKYNVGAHSWQRPSGADRIILVPGQVESDASLAYGAPGERTNIGLLKAVRLANPDAYVVYKPHPDVHARLRAEGQDESAASRWCNEVVTDAAMGDLLMAVDEVHVLTSLAGFEALLRGKSVTCYGQPFYAGWGLTQDVIPIARRSRRLLLDELVAGALILYPLYLGRDGKHLITPEQALDELSAWRLSTGGKDPWWRKIVRVFLRRIIGVR